MSAPTVDPVDQVLARLDHRRDGAGWAAPCPAHDDRGTGLVIRRDPHGRPDLRCDLCSPAEVYAALGIDAPAARPRGTWRVSGDVVDPADVPQAELDHDPGAPVPPEVNAPPWQVPHLSDPHHGLLLPAIHAVIAPHLERARAHGPIPPLRSDAWLDAHPDQQLASVLIAGVDRILFDPRALVAGLIRDAGKDVAGSAGAALAEQSARTRDAARTRMRGAVGRCWGCGCPDHHERPGTGGCRTCGCPRQHNRSEGSR